MGQLRRRWKSWCEWPSSAGPTSRPTGSGLQSAHSGVRLAQANRYQDAYLLYQPFTFQNNAPFGKQSATSWALGMTLPLPVYNRNQGNIERARLNVTQSQIELAGIERRVVTEVSQAAREYEVSGQIVQRIRTEILPSSESFRNDRFKLFQGGETNAVTYLQAQRSYNDNCQSLPRHRGPASPQHAGAEHRAGPARLALNRSDVESDGSPQSGRVERWQVVDRLSFMTRKGRDSRHEVGPFSMIRSAPADVQGPDQRPHSGRSSRAE